MSPPSSRLKESSPSDSSSVTVSSLSCSLMLRLGRWRPDSVPDGGFSFVWLDGVCFASSRATGWAAGGFCLTGLGGASVTGLSASAVSFLRGLWGSLDVDDGGNLAGDFDGGDVVGCVDDNAVCKYVDGSVVAAGVGGTPVS